MFYIKKIFFYGTFIILYIYGCKKIRFKKQIYRITYTIQESL